MDAVSVNDLSFRDIFDKVNFTVEKGSFTTFIGKDGCGKSTLFKILTLEEDFDFDISILNKSIKYSFEKGYVGIVSPSFIFEGTVIDKLVGVLKDKGRPFDKIKSEIQRAVKKTGIQDILYYDYNDLSLKERVLVSFTVQILYKPKVLLIDNAFSYLDDEREKIVREVKRLNKKNTVINITNNTNECVYGSDVIILGDFKKYKVNEMCEDDFISCGLEVPFMISLSERLKFYEVISNNYLDMERLVNDLWE